MTPEIESIDDLARSLQREHIIDSVYQSNNGLNIVLQKSFNVEEKLRLLQKYCPTAVFYDSYFE